MNSGEYSLRWKKYHDNLVANVCTFYEHRIFTDVTIACDGRHFKAHKLVLAACSPYFEKLFKEHPTEHPIIYLNDVNGDYMENIMEFMYKGTTNLEAMKVKPFLNLAENLKLKGLTERPMAEDEPRQPHHEQDEEGLSTLPIYTPTAVAPLLESVLDHEMAAPESSGMVDSMTDEQPGHSSTPLDRSNARKVSAPRTAIECVEALMGMDHNSSSEDGFLSGSSSAPLNHARHNNLKPAIKHPRSTHTNASSERQQENDFDRAMEYNESPPLILTGLSEYERPRSSNDFGESSSSRSEGPSVMRQLFPNDLRIAANDNQRMGHMDIPAVAPGEKWFQGRLQFMLSQRGKPLLVHDGHSFGIQYIRKDKKYWQCNLSRKYNCKARVTTTDTGDIIVTNNEHCHTEIRQHLRKDYKTMKLAASLAASRAPFAISLALPPQSNPAIECSSTTSATSSTVTTNDTHPIQSLSGRPDTEQEIRSINLSRMEQVPRLSS
ncbi:broad-complex core protein isoforms 1/2/3/4/5-like [Anopheles ziemanni]|uniref:broad-complex core protein isoforms 1/2/3/4/5-like n=1 Tax=Anopheles coustani TaxID=139045 RepID=UPI002659BE8E|nr:broad-complex core protein isoforms 1/2/3/4/5-like [Anopheles coustani]XP_058175613.1 broad-complex core protein isoforms 1/2/3/4/5-like [Anopheles ziemanni]